jgi:hypothetical protein
LEFALAGSGRVTGDQSRGQDNRGAGRRDGERRLSVECAEHVEPSL